MYSYIATLGIKELTELNHFINQAENETYIMFYSNYVMLTGSLN